MSPSASAIQARRWPGSRRSASSKTLPTVTSRPAVMSQAYQRFTARGAAGRAHGSGRDHGYRGPGPRGRSPDYRGRALGDPDIMVAFDAGYDLTRLAWLLRDLPVEVLGRLRSDRVMYFPAPERAPGANGRPPRPGAALRLADPGTWPEPAQRTVTVTSRYGTAQATAWARLHQKLTIRAGWEDHDGGLPVVEGTLIRLHVIDHPPGFRPLEPMWLWSSRPAAGPGEVNRIWQAYLRRASTSSTPSGSSSRPSAGPALSSATPPPPTAGPGSSSPATPSSGSPGPSPPASGSPGSSPARPAA
jgi:hypothetical protein